MRMHASSLAALLGLSLLAAGCPAEKTSTDFGDGGGGGSGGLVITASKSTVVADGDNFVDLTVTNTTGTDATLVLSPAGRGSLSAATVPGAGGTVTLTTCVAGVGTCAGVATVTATAGTQSDTVSVTFADAATACASNCNADAACSGLACTAVTDGQCSGSYPALTCLAANDPGGDPGTATGIVVTPSRTRLPPSGQTEVVVKLTGATTGAPVALATTAGTLSSATGTTDSSGKATFTLTMGANPAVATLTATSTALAGVSGTATVTVPRLGSISILSDTPVQHPVQGAKDSGWNEQGYVQVQVLDDQGVAYPDGLPVRFEHRQLGGSTFAGTLTADTATCLAASRCVGFQGTTSSGEDPADSLGLALAWLQSGTVAGTLQVVASATVGGVTRTATLPTIAVVGAKANGANFSIVCSPRNVPALAETDCAVSWVEAPFTCMAILKDRYNNLLGTSTQVIFESEAAGVGQITWTTAYGLGSRGDIQNELGTAVQIFNTLGAGLPFDVPAVGGEPWAVHGMDGCGLRTHNPRDGVVTVLAVADGEEAFFDANGNGVYDAGEPFVDQGEPYVDVNDNGAYDVGEPFLNVDGSVDNPATPAVNEAYTQANGVWDGNTKIWTQTVVVYTGVATQVPETDALGVPTGDLLGTRWSATEVQACVASAPDAAFAVTHSVTGPPAVVASTEDHWVYSSDLNLNMLHSGATYAAAMHHGPASLEYFGLASYADELGFFYRYWPCDKSGANCASQCRVTGAGLPCLMKPSLSAWSCGPKAAVTFKGGTEAGTALAKWTISTPYEVYLDTNKTAFDWEWLDGDVTTPP